MIRRDRSLSLDEGEEAGTGRMWAVISDVALALVLVLALFILAQFLHYDNVAVIEKIEERRAEVAGEIRQAAAGLLETDEETLEIVAQGFTQQRVTFPEPMLFEPCGTVPRDDGQALIREIGRVLHERAGYLEAIQIEGHADRRPPTGLCRELVVDNWGLSSLRATSFVRVLVTPDVFPDSAKVTSVGRGDTQPRSGPGATDDELGEDRRVELILVYSEDSAREALGSL